ncbi:purine-cytosine permease family protein [Pseudonocardia abyssalis]|uniref:purine-cytosine permease family protein n=2 Tax=Pseudonocardia abyssalis TaxID=2792008 RepID=UPI001CED5BDC|nr:allantoin permease [Pseudonocardia abyssalis]
MSIDDVGTTTDPAPTTATSETLEDYTLRYAPSTYRKWTPGVVATTALGGIAYLADFAIGGSIGLTYGTGNALIAILVGVVVIFTTGLPLAYYGARYNIDLDLVSRGAGFGYYGSVLTNVIFATFTFIFFALEGSIMAQGLLLGLGIPLWLGYLLSTLIIIPIVIFGMSALSKMQVWTTPLWLILMVGPFVYLVVAEPASVGTWLAYEGTSGPGISITAIALGAGVALSLMAQIGEQVDYLRFMPARTEANKRSWWAAVIAAGPGWVLLGGVKQAAGAFLAVYIVGQIGAVAAVEPVQQFNATFSEIVPGWVAVLLAVILVVISQIKINATNAYSGSLAWTNSFTRVTKRYPRRIVFVFINLAFALTLMEANMFASLNYLLGFYANCAIAWVTTVAADIAINKYLLGISPKEPEFRRAYLYAVNPVGVGSFLVATGVSFAAFFGAFGESTKAWSPFLALGLALVLTPLLAVATKGRYYLKRPDLQPEPRFTADGTPATTTLDCAVCGLTYERPDMVDCSFHSARLCSLCCSTDKACETVCHESQTFLGLPMGAPHP